MKKALTLGSLLVVSLLMFLPTVCATRPTTVSGTFDYTFEITSERWINGHYIFEATEWETWEGDFQGTAISFFTVVWFNYPDGPLFVWLRGTFTGTVLGKAGTMTFRLVGWRPLPDDWSGLWVITSGTDELANLRGQGIWGGPGFDAPGPDIWYSGRVHFR